jgi:hypothetical protein
MAASLDSTRAPASPLIRGDLTFNRSALMLEAWRRTRAKGRFAAAHGGFSRFLRDAWATAKAIRADMAQGGPERREREAAAREASFMAFLVSRSADERARQDAILGMLCSTDGRLPATRRAELRTLTAGGARH